MKSIICGAGDVGYSIADKLSKENFEVTVIDESKERLKKISDTLDVKTFMGVPSLPSTLSLAVSPSDLPDFHSSSSELTGLTNRYSILD